MHEENNQHFTFCELSHDGAADSLLDIKCMYCNFEIKYVCIAN